MSTTSLIRKYNGIYPQTIEYLDTVSGNIHRADLNILKNWLEIWTAAHKIQYFTLLRGAAAIEPVQPSLLDVRARHEFH
jgi:hypothetical protein